MLFGKGEDFGVGDLRDFFPGFAGVFLVHQVFVSDEAGGVIEQIAHGDGAAVSGEVRKNVCEVIVIVQLAVVNEKHNGHGRELLGERGEAEVRTRVDGKRGTQIAHAIFAFEEGLAILANEDGEAGFLRRGNAGENGIELIGCGRLRGCRRSKGQRCEETEGCCSAAKKALG